MFVEAAPTASTFFLIFDLYLDETKWRHKAEKSRLCE